MIKKLVTSFKQNFTITTTKQIITILICSFIADLVYPLLMINDKIPLIVSPGMWGFLFLITKPFYEIIGIPASQLKDLHWSIFATTGFVILNIPILIFICFKAKKTFVIYTFFIIFLNMSWSWVLYSCKEGFENWKKHLIQTDYQFVNIIVGATIWGFVYGLMLKNGGTAGDIDTIIIYKTRKHNYGFEFFLKLYYISTQLLYFFILLLIKEKKSIDIIVNSILVSFIFGSVMAWVFRYFNNITNDWTNTIYNCNFLYKNITLILSMFFLLTIIKTSLKHYA